MKRALRVFGQVLKALAITVVGAAVRIGRAQGKGVIEETIQNAIYEVADHYVRSVKTA